MPGLDGKERMERVSTPAKAGVQSDKNVWTPAFAGVQPAPYA